MYFKIEQRICGGKRPAAAEDTFNQWFLREALIKLARAGRREFFRRKEARNRRNTVCISRLSNEFAAEKDRRLPKTHLISGSLGLISSGQAFQAAQTASEFRIFRCILSFPLGVCPEFIRYTAEHAYIRWYSFSIRSISVPPIFSASIFCCSGGRDAPSPVLPDAICASRTRRS